MYLTMIATNTAKGVFNISVRKFQGENSYHKHWVYNREAGTATMTGRKSENHGFDGEIVYTVLQSFDSKKEAESLATAQKLIMVAVGMNEAKRSHMI